jgi:hypothetical protein
MVLAVWGANLTLKPSSCETLRSDSYMRKFICLAGKWRPLKPSGETILRLIEHITHNTQRTSGRSAIADSLSQIDTVAQTSYDSTQNLA